jgi:hypothetical protein
VSVKSGEPHLHDAGNPAIPLNFKLGPPSTGAQRLFEYGLSGNNAHRLFQTEGDMPSHSWLNRIEMPSRKSALEGVRDLQSLLEALIPPKAFVIRLLDSEHPDYKDVQDFFDTVVQPVIEGELGYKLTVVDGNQAQRIRSHS